MTFARIASLALAALTSGLIAGVFYAYAISVMPALHRVDDRTLVDVMQKINVAIINPWFMIGFLGTVGFSLLAVALHLGREQRGVLLWIVAALVLNVIAIIVTGALNIPLNNQIDAVGVSATAHDLAAVRADFESAWVRWNIVRAVLNTMAFAACMGALYMAGVQQARAR